MNREAIYHQMDSNFCFAKSPNELVLRIRTAHGDFSAVECVYECKYVFGQTQKHAPMRLAFSDNLYDYFTVCLKLSDVRVTYVFRLKEAVTATLYYFSEDGLSRDYNFTLAYYNCFQMPYIHAADLHKNVAWVQSATFYQVFVDRFFSASVKDIAYINLKWGDKPHPKSFAGGDLDGITQKLDYIHALGFNALYLTPVFASVSNHKYDTYDYMSVDKQFGGDKALITLAQQAHKKGIRLVLDAVFNHGSEWMAEFQDVLKNGKNSRYYDWFMIHKFSTNPQEMDLECFAACKYMPKWNTSNPEVQDFLIEKAVYWTKKLDLDGWRLDVSDEVSHDFWRKFRKAIKAVNPDVVIIGENWHNAASNLCGDQFDSIMNYAVTKAMLDYFAYDALTADGLAQRLSAILMRNTDTANGMMMNLIDNHDTHRFLNLVAGDEKKLHAALALTYLFTGAPCVYYGTEIALIGGYDPDNRRCMDWLQADKGHPIMDLLRTLAALRQTNAVKCGDIVLSAENGVFILQRRHETESLVLAINYSGKAQTVQILNVSKILDDAMFCVYHTGKGKCI